MRSVNILTGGEILAEPIMTEEQNVLIPKGTALKIDYIPLIESLGIDSLMIEDPYEEFEEPHLILDHLKYEMYVEKVRKVLGNHIHNQGDGFREFKILANEIVKDVDALSNDAAIDISEHAADLYEHTVMVTLLSVLIAKKMKLKKNQRYAVALGGLLHDVGIRYITTRYENRNLEEINELESFEYRKHTILGYCAMEKATWIPEISKKMVLSHHERLDRSGFPMRQSNDEIECRILQVCDAFDSMISGVEAKRTSVHAAHACIRKLVGTQFDEQVVTILGDIVAMYPVGTTIKTSDEEQTVVVSQTSNPERPIVMVLDETTMKPEGTLRKLRNLLQEKDISILQVI